MHRRTHDLRTPLPCHHRQPVTAHPMTASARGIGGGERQYATVCTPILLAAFTRCLFLDGRTKGQLSRGRRRAGEADGGYPDDHLRGGDRISRSLLFSNWRLTLRAYPSCVLADVLLLLLTNKKVAISLSCPLFLPVDTIRWPGQSPTYNVQYSSLGGCLAKRILTVSGRTWATSVKGLCVCMTVCMRKSPPPLWTELFFPFGQAEGGKQEEKKKEM